jgi:hypothetical protein
MTLDTTDWPVMTETEAEAKLANEIAKIVARGRRMVLDGLSPREAASQLVVSSPPRPIIAAALLALEAAIDRASQEPTAGSGGALLD